MTDTHEEDTMKVGDKVQWTEARKGFPVRMTGTIILKVAANRPIPELHQEYKDMKREFGQGIQDGESFVVLSNQLGEPVLHHPKTKLLTIAK